MPDTSIPSIETNNLEPSAMVGGYEGASRVSKELMFWTPTSQSADGDILDDKELLDARVKDSMRNDAYVKNAESTHKDSIVGYQYRLNLEPKYEVLGLTKEWAEAFKKEVESKWALVAESPNNYLDISGVNTFTELIRLAVGIYLTCGEFLATAEWDTSKGRPFSTAIKVIDTDRLSNPINRALLQGINIKGGVEKTETGKPIAYWIRSSHPTEQRIGKLNTWDRVLAKKPWGRQQVIHILEQDRADQTRGVSSLVTALSELRMIKKHRGVSLQNAIINASYAATIESELDPSAVLQMLGGQDTSSQNINDTITNYMTGYLGVAAKFAGSSNAMRMDGNKIPHLPPGSKLNLLPAGKGGPLGGEFEQSLLRNLAASLNISYEQLSKDYSNTNYSSARAAMNETWKFMQSRKKIVADRLANIIFRLWFEEIANNTNPNSLRFETLPKNGPNIYVGLNFDAYTNCTWQGASRGQIDELKESQAAMVRMTNGLSSLKQECAKLGSDWREVMDQRAAEKDYAEKLGLPIANTNQDMANALSGTPGKKAQVAELLSDGED